jgi:electron transport complex protein RnfC
VTDIHINPNHLHSFHGGLILKHHKNDSLGKPLTIASIPDKLYLSLRINRGNVSTPVVSVGDKVLKGQIIAVPDTSNGSYIHASSSGTISAIGNKETASPDADIAMVIEITTDKKDLWCDLKSFNNYASNTPECIISAIKDAGLTGLGGAGFPTHLKYSNKDISTLIINGAECEPYISCDQQLMMDYPQQLIEGTLLMLKAANAKQAILALEDQVGGIQSKLEKLISEQNLNTITIVKVPTIYPAGGEKQLIKVLTGKEVPSGGIPLDLGMIVQNVGTVKALYDYIKYGQPLIDRIITVAGDAVNQPQNYKALIGTPISHLLHLADYDNKNSCKLIIGGPMMGFAMPHDDIGIDKTSNCLLALSEQNTKQSADTLPCIRCGDCVNVCPANLLPQQLHWYIKGENLEKAREHNLFDCIECGACAWVCPSQIKLVDYYRYAKSELKYLDFKRVKSDQSQIRFEQRENRLQSLKEERIAKRKRTKNRTSNPERIKRDLQATLDRVSKAKKISEDTNE